MANLDTDGDGLSDTYEQSHGTNALVADTDHDGLSDGAEVARGLNPTLLDSNNDGLSDGFAADHDLLGSAGGAAVPGADDPTGGLGAGTAGGGLGAIADAAHLP
jgi:hypothetical protein